MNKHVADFEYETRTELGKYTLYMTEDAVAENIEVTDTSAITSDAYGGIRIVSPEGNINDYEIFGRLGEKIVDIVSMDGSCKEWEEVDLPLGLGEDNHEEILISVAKTVGVKI